MKKIVFMMLLAFMAMSVSGTNAEIIADAVVGGGYQGNLFNDSGSIEDQYATFGANLKYYPTTSIQLAGAAFYNSYSAYSDLSNVGGEASITCIPTSSASPFMLALGADVAAKKFGVAYEMYNQVGTMLSADLRYQMSRNIHLISTASFNSSSYTNSTYGSNRSIDLAAGFNATIIGSNAIAIRFDYNRRYFDQPDMTGQNALNAQAADRHETASFEVTGILGRYSRPLGNSTGLNLSLGYRQLHVNDNLTVLGYTIDYLSPWAELWEGVSFSGGVKHIFPRQLVGEITAAYYDKAFVDVVEYSETTEQIYWQGSRSDKLTTLSFGLSRPIALDNGKMITPAILFGYRNNRSTAGFFDYNDFEASFSLKFSI